MIGERVLAALRLALGQLRLEVSLELRAEGQDLAKPSVQLNLANGVETFGHDAQKSHLVVGDEVQDGQQDVLWQVQQVDRGRGLGGVLPFLILVPELGGG